MSLGLVGRKVGMTRVFTDDGSAIPVTVLDVGGNRVTQIKTPDNDGYSAVQVTYGKRRASRVTKPQAGHLAKAGVEAGVVLKEFQVAADDLAKFKAGDTIGVDTFTRRPAGRRDGHHEGQGLLGRHQAPPLQLATARRTATRARTTRRARSAWRRIRAACFRASAWRASSATSRAPRSS